MSFSCLSFLAGSDFIPFTDHDGESSEWEVDEAGLLYFTCFWFLWREGEFLASFLVVSSVYNNPRFLWHKVFCGILVTWSFFLDVFQSRFSASVCAARLGAFLLGDKSIPWNFLFIAFCSFLGSLGFQSPFFIISLVPSALMVNFNQSICSDAILPLGQTLVRFLINNLTYTDLSAACRIVFVLFKLTGLSSRNEKMFFAVL